MKRKRFSARIVHAFAALAFVVHCVVAYGQDPSERLIVADGKKRLYRKVVVKETTRMLKNLDDTAGPDVSAFSIFHQLKTEDGAREKNGYVRVGDSFGQHLGWIEKKKTFKWDTRFLLHPKPPAMERVFTVYKDDALSSAIAKLKRVASDQRAIAPILDIAGNEQEPTYKIAFFVGKAKSGMKTVVGVQHDKPNLKKLTLEIVFVVDTTGSMGPVIEGIREVMKKCAQEISKLKVVVRFGLVKYRDSGDEFVARKVCDPIGDVASFIENQLSQLRAEGGGDIREQVLLGLKTAIEDIKWGKFSAKNIILIGDAPAHVDASRNLTKKSISEIINLARFTGGQSDFDSKIKSINFHAVRALLPGGESDDAKLCKRQFEEISSNNGDFKGFYADVDANKRDTRDKAVKELADFLINGFKIYEGLVVKGGLPSVVGDKIASNPLVVQFYELLGTSAGEKNKETEQGWTKTTNKSGRAVAQVKLMVGKFELERLANLLDTLHKEFSRVADIKKRQNVKNLLTSLQILATATAAGQEGVTAGTYLKELVADLPLSTPVLNETTRSIAKMTNKEFKTWLDKLADTRDRTIALIRKKDWIEVTGGHAPDEKYLFLRQAELP